jgi:hypothetical protein
MNPKDRLILLAIGLGGVSLTSLGAGMIWGIWAVPMVVGAALFVVAVSDMR